MSISITLSLLFTALWETMYMVLISGFFATLFGVPLGMILFTSRKGGILENKTLNGILGAITNAFRSVPFIILLVAIVPLTRLIVGTSIGTNAAIVPLVIGAIPFVGRIVENALAEVPQGLIEAAESMGASPLQIMWKFLLPEALSGIINGLTVTAVALVSYSAMAGAVGGGGLGDLGIRYGYQRFDVTMMMATIVVLIVLVQLIQWMGDYASNKLNKK
jgi:D-methionine transport system permease protein